MKLFETRGENDAGSVKILKYKILKLNAKY